MDTIEPAGSWLKVFSESGGWVIPLSEESRIDAAVEQWISSGKQRDTLLQLDLIGGNPLKILASTINAWFECTPEGRRRELEFKKRADDEDESLKAELGIWEES